MRRLLVLLLLLAAPIALRAQTEVSSGPVNPSHCNINKGNLFWNTTSPQIFTCGPTNNNWIAFSAPGVLVTSGLAANRPVSCNPGDLYVDTDDTLIFRCGPANTWTAVGGANPSPPTNALQKNNGSGGLAASVNTDDGTNLNIDENMRTKGPNPWIDVTRYGARIVDL